MTNRYAPNLPHPSPDFSVLLAYCTDHGIRPEYDPADRWRLVLVGGDDDRVTLRWDGFRGEWYFSHNLETFTPDDDEPDGCTCGEAYGNRPHGARKCSYCTIGPEPWTIEQDRAATGPPYGPDPVLPLHDALVADVEAEADLSAREEWAATDALIEARHHWRNTLFRIRSLLAATDPADWTADTLTRVWRIADGSE
jgi:hypothetical protein